MAGYAVTIFLGALLMFLVQPVIAREILPWYGGSAVVWTTCMMFFQVTLLLGYFYAHFLQRWFAPRRAWWIHTGLLALACFTLRTGPPDWLKPVGSVHLTMAICGLLAVTIGLPFVALSATGPLVQAWHSTSHRSLSTRQETYRLYALSNVGSMLALIGYPFLVEPLLAVPNQMRWWCGGFLVFSLACFWSGRQTVSFTHWHEDATSGLGPEDPPSSNPVRFGSLPARWTAWALLAMTPNVLLMAITNLVCGEVASLPFLWILPLALYLSTLIICFERPNWYRPMISYLFSAVTICGAIVLFHLGNRSGLALQVVGFSLALFACCLTCHGELERLKPARRRLTLYYLFIAGGGAVGGLLVVGVAPYLFVDFYELHCGFLLTMVLPVAILMHRFRRVPEVAARLWVESGAGLIAAGMTLGSLLVLWAVGQEPGMLAQCRNEYGRLAVWERPDGYRVMVNGRTDHGGQFSDPARALETTSYYQAGTGPSLAVEALANSRENPSTPLHWGVIGLGTGSLVANGGEQDQFTFYEINPAVERLAREFFLYLDRAGPRATVVLGDGRIELERELRQSGPHPFDLLVLDAFHSDSIPAHLLTREAFDLYRQNMRDDGILVLHITNRFADLRPVVRGLAEDRGWTSVWIEHAPSSSRWALLAARPELLASPSIRAAQTPWPDDLRPRLWTDDFASLAHVVNWSFALDWSGLFKSVEKDEGDLRQP